jgi:hypothetical protein
MKVGELRTVLKKYDQATLSDIIISLYKVIPKKIKEEKEIDEVLNDFSNKKLGNKAPDLPVDFRTLVTEVLRFVVYAEAQYYFAPNSYVHKKDRPKWRFIAKRYIKALLAVTGENAEASTDLLNLIYRMLSHGCNYWIFSTDNPFSSVGFEQTELLSIVIAKNFHYGVNTKTMRKVIGLVLESNVDRMTLHTSLFLTFVDNLKSNDAKTLAAEECLYYAKENFGKAFQDDNFFQVKRDEYYENELHDLVTELYFHINASLYEYDEAIRYYWDHHKSKKERGKYQGYAERQNEISLYILLKWLEMYGEDELWICEYEKATDKGIKPRSILVNQYEYVKSGESLDTFYNRISDY